MHRNTQKVNKFPTELRVSAHAVRRYLERELGWSIPDDMTDAQVVVRIRQEVGSHGLRAIENRIIADEHLFGRAVVVQNTVVTILPRVSSWGA
jgi:hypothetical protein